MPEPVRFVDRATGRLVEEQVFGEGALRFLYGGIAGRTVMALALRHRWASALYGAMQRLPGSRRKVPEFVRSLGIDAAEASRPLEDYASLDDFFTRRLRAGARPVDADPRALVSPADGRALAIPRLEEELAVKGSRVSVAELLGSEELAARYRGGSALVVRLAPADYHRFHFPDGGSASPPRRLGRHLHSVHAIALAAGAPSFRNARQAGTLASDGFGELALVEVGALCVGSIRQTHAPGPVLRGQEKGVFHFGGSTVIVLAEPGRLRLDDDLVASSGRGLETLVRMGSRVGTAG